MGYHKDVCISTHGRYVMVYGHEPGGPLLRRVAVRLLNRHGFEKAMALIVACVQTGSLDSDCGLALMDWVSTVYAGTF